jgi:branched-chain amino acid transport system permease protein
VHLLVQAFILGLLTGGVYALMASGLTLAFGVMRVVNVAQGALIVLGAYLSHSLFVGPGIDPFISILVMTPVAFALGVLALAHGLDLTAYMEKLAQAMSSNK